MKHKDYEVRKNKPTGILWKGYCYESIPAWGDTYLAVIEDCGDYLVMQRYDSNDRWWTLNSLRLVGEPKRVNKIGIGRPTNWRINALGEVVEALSK